MSFFSFTSSSCFYISTASAAFLSPLGFVPFVQGSESLSLPHHLVYVYVFVKFLLFLFLRPSLVVAAAFSPL